MFLLLWGKVYLHGRANACGNRHYERFLFYTHGQRNTVCAELHKMMVEHARHGTGCSSRVQAGAEMSRRMRLCSLQSLR